MIFIDWADLETSRRLQDGDVVTAIESDIAPGQIEFVIELAPHKDWWKGAQLLDNTDVQVGFVETQGFGGVSEVLSSAAVDVVVGGKLILWKAKLFGVHTPLYVIADLERKVGKRITLRWSAD